MLTSLKINNIAVIESSEPKFTNGLNVLTGETGAGKSIIVDSINAILGERTSKSLIRNGSEKATVIAVFSNVSDYCRGVFEEYDIEPDDGEYVFQRSLSLSGKTSCRINGVPVNTNDLKKIGECLINIHGQHDNQLLLNPEKHCMFLDAFAGIQNELNDYKASFDKFNYIRRELKKCIEAERSQYERFDILKFQINEIEQANLSEDELERSKKRLSECENSERITVIASKLSNILGGSDGTVSDMLDTAVSELSKLCKLYPELNSAHEHLTSALIDIDFARGELDRAIDSVEYEPGELNQIQNRIEYVNEIIRKYGNSVTSTLNYLHDAKSQIDGIEVTKGQRIQYENELLQLQDELINKAKLLSKKRELSAQVLSENITGILKFLDMEEVCFKVNMDQGSYTSHGTDRVEFLISANKGQKLMPLSKVASGGELSRTMLAIKSVLADNDKVDTLIFDEIDTGISGRAARKIAIQLKRISKLKQVICITHLAQIAASADNHMLIEKNTHDEKTYTSVSSLSGDDRIKEVARIMAGSEITENLYNTAKELIETQSAEE